MSNYGLYQVHFTEWLEKTLNLQHLDGTSILQHAQEHFGSYFKGAKLDLYKKGRDGEITRLHNDILRVVDGVILLRINNTQLKSIYSRKEPKEGGIPDYQEDKIESYPFSYVVIDNRQGICQIAIEKSATWGSSTDLVRDILEEWFKDRLHSDYGLNLSIDLKWQEAEFWDYVEERYRDFGDVITQMKFDVINPKKVAPYNGKEDSLSGFVKSMVDMTRLLGLLKSTMVMDMDENSRLTKEKRYEDIVQMVRLCSSNSYSLSVTFKDYGEYRCTDMVKAIFALDDKLLNEFRYGEKVIGDGSGPEGTYGLIEWLDKVHRETIKFTDGSKAPRKPKRKGSK